MYRNEKYMDAMTLDQQLRAFKTMTECTSSYQVKRKIVCAANLYKGVLLLGVRHFDPIMHYDIMRLGLAGAFTAYKQYEHAQGFIDQYGVFCDRVEAMQIIKDSGQPFDIQRTGGSDTELYSEGIH